MPRQMGGDAQESKIGRWLYTQRGKVSKGTLTPQQRPWTPSATGTPTTGTSARGTNSRAGCAVGLVGCASQKLKRPVPARELYVSQLFKKASAYAELTCDRWFVLSAMHGLVHSETVLEP